MLSPSIECEGSIQINDKIVATKVTLRTVENSALLVKDDSVSPRYQMLLRSFPLPLIASSRMVEGTQETAFEFSQPENASWSYGPLGHPGDGEFEVRRLKTLTMTIVYSSLKAVINLHGVTEPGGLLFKGVSDQSQTELLPPWNFSVSLLLPVPSAEALYIEDSLADRQ